MFSDKESGVGVRGTVRAPALRMTDRSVRKRQQPPSLKRLKLSYADGEARSTVHGLTWRARLREVGSLIILLLAEQRRGWRLMIFCARATRGLRRPSLDARSGRSISPHP